MTRHTLRLLTTIYDLLYTHWGPQHWWPGDTPIEIIVGAILTQNTAWTNVEKAIIRLKEADVLNPTALYQCTITDLAEWIRPAGYYNVKARRIKAFSTMLHDQHNDSLKRLFRLPTPDLREVLLSVNGIGPETADSILLYAAMRPVFVVDAYTRRFLLRHRWIDKDATYDDIARFFTAHLDESVQLFNEYHALIVALGKHYCKPKPRCDQCPLRALLPKRGIR